MDATFYLAAVKQGDGDENTIATLGLRWDVTGHVAVKLELSRMDVVVGNTGIYRGSLFGVESDADPEMAGGTLILPADTVNVFGMAVDVVF